MIFTIFEAEREMVSFCFFCAENASPFYKEQKIALKHK